MARRRGPRADRRQGDPTRRDRLRRHLLDLIAQAGLSPSVARTARELLDRSDKFGAAPFPARETIAGALGIAPCTVTRHCARLEAAGFLTVDRAKPFEHATRGWTRWRTNRYRFCRPTSGGSSSPTKAQERPRHPGPTPTVSSPPAPTQGELYQETHPPPPSSTGSPRDAIDAAWQHLAGSRAARRRRADANAGLR